jgi:hypothetical protein
MTSIFEKRIEDYLTVYKIPIGPGQLDPTVFYFSEIDNTPRLLPAIHSQICRDVETLGPDQPSRIKNYYLVGPAVTPGNKNRSGELRVIIVINKDILDVDVDGVLAERILKAAKQMSGKHATGTTRPIEYVITTRDVENDQYTGIYNLGTSDWKRTPNGLTK